MTRSRKKGKLHNAVATCILDKRAKTFPASHKWARSQKMHLNGLRLKNLERHEMIATPKTSHHFSERLGTPPAHQQQQLPLHVLTAYCIPLRQTGLAPAAPTAVVTYLCPEFTPGLLASHLPPKRQRLATAGLCEHTPWNFCLVSSSAPHAGRRKIDGHVYW